MPAPLDKTKTSGRVTGHVSLRKRERGSVYYLNTGSPMAARCSASSDRHGRNAAAHPRATTRAKLAEQTLQEILADARRGTGDVVARPAPRSLMPPRSSCATSSRTANGSEPSRRLPGRDQQLPVASVRPPGTSPRLPARDRGVPRRAQGHDPRPDGTRRLSNRTIVRHLVVLHAIFKRAARLSGVQVNPASGGSRRPSPGPLQGRV